MKIKLLILVLLLLAISNTKSETKKVEEITVLCKELKGFEADYLTKVEFRKQVKDSTVRSLVCWAIAHLTTNK
jgi:hypothetical protein